MGRRSPTTAGPVSGATLTHTEHTKRKGHLRRRQNTCTPLITSISVNNAERASHPLTIATFPRFASAAFRHKRKTLRNNLAPVYGKDRVDAIAEMGKRAEQLSLGELAALFRSLSAAVN